LDGTRVTVRDSSGVARVAALFFISPAQINFQIPPGTAAGPATLTIVKGEVAVSVGRMQIAAVAAGLFTANSDGRGVPAGYALRVKNDGTQRIEAIASEGGSGLAVPVPIDLGPQGDQMYLVLFGTGLRRATTVTASLGGVNLPVLAFAAHGTFVGLDQINLGPIDRSFAGRGELDLVLTVNNQPTNTVKVNIR
jgi:uncharacterized protein (TIGR03437 family)